MITKVRTIVTKKGPNAGSKMAVFILEDLQGKAEVVLFPDVLNKFADSVVEDRVIFLMGKIDRRRESPNVFASELIKLEEVRDKLAAKIKIELLAADVTKEKVEQIKSICQHYRGNSPVFISVRTDKARILARTDESLFVSPDVDFCKKMKQLVGDENFQLTR
jgi:DNA polymerase-3 subunit alpha